MQSDDARILRGSAIIAAPLGIAATVVSALVAGEKGLVGGLVAVAVVAVFFGLGSAALMRLTQDRPQLAMTAGLLVYAVQILLIGVFVVVFRDTTLFSGRAFGLSLLVTALAWVGGQIRHSLTSKMLYVHPEPSVPAEEAGSSSPVSEAVGQDAAGSVSTGSRNGA
jgi:ATP synthase protein I